MVEERKEERPKVMVGCKMPNGLELRVMRRRNDDYAVNGVTGAAAAIEDKGFIKLDGPKAGDFRSEVFTPVDEELWKLWLAENGEHSLVQGGTVFVREPEPEGADDSKEDTLRGGEVKHGDSPLEPVEEEHMPEPEPTAVHDPVYRDNFKDHAGQEQPDEPTLRGATKDEMDAKPAGNGKKQQS